MGTSNQSTEQHETIPERKQQNCKPEFDPYEYGKEEGIGHWEAAIHLYRCCTGFNIILLPFIIKNLGWLLGTLAILSTSIVLSHVSHVLVATEYKVCKRLKLKGLSFPELVGQVFNISPYPLNKFSIPVRLVMCIHYTVSVGNANILIIVSSGIQTLAKYFDLHPESIFIISVLVVPLSIISTFPEIIKILVPFSFVTSIFTFCMAVVIIANSVIYMEDMENHITVSAIGDVAFIPKNVAIFMGIAGFSTTAIALKNNMKKPKKLVTPLGALNIATLGAFVFNCSFGVISYICYGDSVRENILLNLPQQSYLSFIVILLYTASVNVNYLLNYFSRFDNLWTHFLKSKFDSTKFVSVLEYSIHITLNLIVYILAVAVPDLTVLSTLLGLSNIIITVTLPIVLELMCLLTDQKRSCWIIFKDICIIGVCAFIFVVSLGGCIEKIMKIYEK